MQADVAIVGCGTAGAAAAALCAARGLSVIAVDGAPRDRAGARWVNGVPRWVFDDAGVPPPDAPERLGEGALVHLVAGWGPDRVLIRDNGMLEVDMRALVARLQASAEGSGARVLDGVRVDGLDDALRTSAGPIRARTYVDAAGLMGPRLLGQRRPPPSDLCAAAQEVREVSDPEAARAWFAENGARPGEVLCFSGVAGGYSIVNVRLDGDHVSLLTGSIPADGHTAGAVLLRRFVVDHPWIGPVVFGGARALPLRRPYPVVGLGRVALLGDAACQLYPAHGSGIAQQLLAARALADAIADGRGAAGYNVDWQRRHGGLLAASDLFCRFSRGLSVSELRTLLRRGVLAPGLMRQGMAQRAPAPSAAEAFTAARGMIGSGAAAARLLDVLARTPLVERHYRRYPADPSRLPGWIRRLELLTGIREA